MADHKKTPGLMLVDPRVFDASHSDKFFKWTKLHYRDLVSVPHDAVYGGFTQTLRFGVPDNTPGYSLKHAEGHSPLFYNCVLDDIDFMKQQAYVDVSRALDLENTPGRPLLEGEEGVGQPGMVFEIVDARFAIYEVYPTDVKAPPYQTLPKELLTPSTSAWTQPPPSYAIAVSINHASPDPAVAIQAALVDAVGAGASYKVFTTVYKFRRDAQPYMHPEIFPEGDDRWLVVVTLFGDGLPERKAVEEKVESVTKGKEGVEKWGVWEGQIAFGRV